MHLEVFVTFKSSYLLGEDFNQSSLFSEYKIIKKIGQGGFGAVMLGVHKVTKEEVALKFVNAHAYGKFYNRILNYYKQVMVEM